MNLYIYRYLYMYVYMLYLRWVSTWLHLFTLIFNSSWICAHPRFRNLRGLLLEKNEFLDLRSSAARIQNYDRRKQAVGYTFSQLAPQNNNRKCSELYVEGKFDFGTTRLKSFSHFLILSFLLTQKKIKVEKNKCSFLFLQVLCNVL